MDGPKISTEPVKRKPQRLLNAATAYRICVLLVAACAVPSVVHAAGWQRDLSISSTVEYDSNSRLRDVDRESVWRARVVPGLALKRIDGPDEVLLTAQMRLERSTDSSISDNRNDPSVSLGWRHATERGGFGLKAAYDRSTTRLTEFDEDDVTRGDQTRVKRSLSGDWGTALSERFNLTLNGGYDETTYDGEGIADRSILTGGVTLSYTVTPLLESYGTVSASRSDPEGEDASRLVSGVIGMKWQATERLDWAVQGGITNISGQDSDEERGADWQGAVILHYAAPRTDYVLDISRGANSSATTSGRFATVEQIRGTVSFAVDERTSVGADLSWRDVDDQTPVTWRQLGVWISRELAPSWQARLGYLRKERDENGLRDAAANVISLTLSYNYSNF